MLNNPILIFHYTDAITLRTTTKTFEQAVNFIMKVPRFASHPPLKMVVESTGKILYFDEPKFQAFIDGNLEAAELIDQTECDGLFRNKVDVQIAKHDIIDSGSLWKRKGKTLYLIDEDRHLPIVFPDDNFIEI